MRFPFVVQRLRSTGFETYLPTGYAQQVQTGLHS
jgi:hypothetical protein